MALGFTWGGWTTERATVMTDLAVRNAKADLVASICVHNFVNASNAHENLKALQEKSSWQRDDFITEGGWAKIAGIDGIITNAADACADQLVKMKELPQSRGDSCSHRQLEFRPDVMSCPVRAGPARHDFGRAIY